MDIIKFFNKVLKSLIKIYLSDKNLPSKKKKSEIIMSNFGKSKKTIKKKVKAKEL
jgi:hypothetical protein